MAAQPIIGRTIGSYRIEARIGAGSMGEVYRARDGKLDRPVALKMFPRGIGRAGSPPAVSP
jgi:serine/threonine-protein kinase